MISIMIERMSHQKPPRLRSSLDRMKLFSTSNRLLFRQMKSRHLRAP